MATPRTPKPDDAPDTPPVEDAVVVDSAGTPAAAEMPPPVMIDLAATPDDLPPRPEPAPTRPVEVRRGPGFVPLFLGGVLAAGVGFGLAQVAPGGWPLGQDSELAAKVTAQEAEIARLSAALAEVPAPAPPDFAPVETEMAALSARIDKAEAAATAAQSALAALPPPGPAGEDLSPRLDEIVGRLAALEAMPPGTVVQGGGDPAAVAALRQEIATLRTAMQAPDGPAQAAVAEVTAAADAARAALAETVAQAEQLKADAQAAAEQGRMQAALGRMRAALESGAPFATAVADLQGGGAEVAAPLADAAAQGVPTLAALQTRFPEAARAALEASLRADMGDSTVERLGSFLRTQVGARSLTPREGSDPDAVLSRAEAAVAEGRLADALTEIAALPEPGQAALAEWRADAQRRLDATAALDALAVTLGEG